MKPTKPIEEQTIFHITFSPIELISVPKATDNNNMVAKRDIIILNCLCFFVFFI